jgi:purine nucleosidase
MAKELLVMDVDTGIDDALALILAFRSPGAEVLAIGTVAGNVAADQAALNTLKVLDVVGAHVPVAVGLNGGLLRPASVVPSVHGADGMGDAGLPAPSRRPSGEHAVDQLIRLAHERPGEITLFASGPLSNVAAALIREPELPRLLKRVVIMGGAVAAPGNVTAVAEANIWHDPEAAQLVFAAGWPLTMVGLDVTMTTFLRPAQLDQLRASDRPIARFVTAISPVYINFYQGVTGRAGYALHDPLALAIALDATLVTEMVELDVQVETHSPLTLGMTVADRRPLLGPGYPRGEHPVQIPLAVDRERFVQRLMDALLS